MRSTKSQKVCGSVDRERITEVYKRIIEDDRGFNGLGGQIPEIDVEPNLFARYQFMETLMRVAEAKYLRSNKTDSLGEVSWPRT